ncbi:MAG: 50S ribosomal protein L29 [Patescibacteria group bacterium]
MKKKELQNFKTKPSAELQKEIREQREKLEGLSFDLAAGKVKNIREIRHLKKNIAQILTLLKQHA